MSQYIFIYHGEHKCPKCEAADMIKDTSICYPPQYKWKCPSCGYETFRFEEE